jgi:hypothetical protein
MATPLKNPIFSNSFRLAWFITFSILVFGLVLTWILKQDPISDPNLGGEIYFVLFTRHESPLLILAAFSMILILGSCRRCNADSNTTLKIESKLGNRFPWLAALFVLAITGIGCNFVYHHFPLAMDEYMSTFQAKIFREGRFFGEIPKQWWNFSKALTPHFAQLHSQSHQWIANYLPVYALLRATAEFVKLDLLLNPLLSALSILLIARVAKLIWPDQKEQSIVCVLLLATSAQFLITGMSFYSMPAHLCFNLFWLYLFLSGGRLGHGLAPWIGIAALNLHQPHVHALFVAPFLFQVLFSKSMKKILYYTAIYGLGIFICVGWMDMRRPPPIKPSTMLQQTVSDRLQKVQTSSSKSFREAIHLPTSQQLSIQPCNTVLFVNWQSMALTLLSLMALAFWKKMPKTLHMLTQGILLTLVFYCLFDANQGHGWGYRYAHAILGNFVLLAAFGWIQLKNVLSPPLAVRLLVFSTLFSLFVQFPFRCVQVENFIRPFAYSSRWIESGAGTSSSTVVIDTRSLWYGCDLVRNDPFLRNSPKIFWSSRLNEKQLEELNNRSKTRMIGYTELKDFGMQPLPLRNHNGKQAQ